MTTFPKAQQRDDAMTPSWLKAARSYYGSAFEAKKKPELAEAMADWGEMDPDERGFVLAHLQYLNLLAQRDTQRLLRELRAAVEEIADEVIEAVEAAGEVEEEGEEDSPDEPVVLDDEPMAAVSRPTLAAVPDVHEADDEPGANDEPAPDPA